MTESGRGYVPLNRDLKDRKNGGEVQVQDGGDECLDGGADGN